MKKLRLFASSLSLILLLTGSALAGDIYIPQPPPQRDSLVVTVPGIKDTFGANDSVQIPYDSVAFGALDLLQNFLSAF